MANQVTFQLKIETVGGDSVKNVTMDAEELGRVVKEVTDEQEKLNTKLLDINQAQQAIQNVTSGISQIASEVSKYTAAYSAQETVERKVAQVMRNTMEASEAEIESIKKLCAAQQELGVIGDEVQMAGAQELATYLEKKSSLEKLIPVMNDMLAQQYGLEASQESAAQIATMLGKVMEGQVNALSRYGYSFDEAQEKILKFGTEEERAAVLAEVVSQSVGGMNQALALTDSGKAKQLANTIGDIKEQMGECLVRIEPFVSGFAEAGMAVQGIMSVSQGIRGLAAGVTSLTIVQRGWNTVSVTTTAIVRTLTVAMHGGTVGATTLKVAIRGLMISTGVGIAIAALTFAIEKLTGASEEASDSLDELTSAERSLAEVHIAGERAASVARVALEREREELAELIESNGDARSSVEKLNEKYGESMGYHQSASEWYDVLVKKSEAYCEQLLAEAEAQEIASRMAENSAQLRANFREQERLRKEGKDARESWSPGAVLARSLGMGAGRVESEEMKKAREQAISLREEGKALREEWDLVKESVKGAAAALGTVGSGTASVQPVGSGGKTAGRTVGEATERVNLGKIEGLSLGGFSADIDLTPRIDEEAAMKDLNNLNWEVEMKVDAQGLKKIDQEAEKARKKFDFATESVQSLGSSLAGLGESIGVPELNFVGIIAQSIATMVQGYASATAQASTMGPWAWLAFGALGLAQLTAMVNGVKNISKFADGAVAYGPTLGLFGEYANAATNPEVVAPLDKLRGLIGTDGGGEVKVRLKVRGRDLVGVSDGRKKLVRRT